MPILCQGPLRKESNVSDKTGILPLQGAKKQKGNDNVAFRPTCVALKARSKGAF